MVTVLTLCVALINVGAFYALACAYAEKYVGFWLAFTLPTIIFMLLPVLLVYMYPRTIKLPPNGSELTNIFHICAVAIKNNGGRFWRNGFWDAAKPSHLAAKGITTWRGKPIAWTDKTVDDVKRTVDACKVFLYFPIYNVSFPGLVP